MVSKELKCQKKNGFVEFKNCHRQIIVPFTIVPNFDSLAVQINLDKFLVKPTEKIK